MERADRHTSVAYKMSLTSSTHTHAHTHVPVAPWHGQPQQRSHMYSHINIHVTVAARHGQSHQRPHMSSHINSNVHCIPPQDELAAMSSSPSHMSGRMHMSGHMNSRVHLHPTKEQTGSHVLVPTAHVQRVASHVPGEAQGHEAVHLGVHRRAVPAPIGSSRSRRLLGRCSCCRTCSCFRRRWRHVCLCGGWMS